MSRNLAARFAQLLPQGAVHQGVALRGAVLEEAALADFAPERGALLLMLDQVTDPQNVGAILRSAAAFGVTGVILQDRHAPKLTGALAKAAAGAVDKAPVAHVVNLARALDELTEAGWRAVGLAGESDRALADVLDGAPTVLVMGSEGEGLRRLVAEHCDEARSAVLYAKPRSVVDPDYVWRRTDRWITFPWSAQPPVAPSAG